MKKDIKINIGETLRNIRKSKLLDVPEVSKETNISIDTIYRYEQGKGNSLDTLTLLLEYYNVKYNIFFKQVYDKCHNK